MNAGGAAEIVLDKGYHSNDVLATLKRWGVRAYCSEPSRGRRNWKDKNEEGGLTEPTAHSGRAWKEPAPQRAERVERSFAHLCEIGGMRRTHLRRHANILKRLLIHVAAFNLGLVNGKISGCGTPRGMAKCV